MKYSTLKAYKISKLEFKNNVKGMVQLSFRSRVSHNVKYSKNGNAEAVLTLTVEDPSNPNSIALEMELSGIYSVAPGASKEAVHMETLREMFTYAKSFVSTITAVAGIKPIIINDIDFENQDIIRYNINDFKRRRPDEEPGGMDDTIDGPDGSGL